LIAEDNLINQKVLNGVLNESGIEVVMADDGQIVLDILEKDSAFDIILMDAHMPRVDGFEATRKIRENPAYDHIAVVALSGDTASDDIRHMREVGMEETLEKPLKMDMLYDVMSMYYTMDESEKEVAGEGPEVEELEIALNVSELASLDYDLGVDICGGDEEMYRGLLRDFFVSYKDSAKKLRDALVQKDYKEVQSILIDLKGTASNLGAKQFIYVVDHFISELSRKNTSAYSGLFKEYQNNLLILLKSIQNAFKV
jgi:CheY-like chemotaxis protein